MSEGAVGARAMRHGLNTSSASSSHAAAPHALLSAAAANVEITKARTNSWMSTQLYLKKRLGSGEVRGVREVCGTAKAFRGSYRESSHAESHSFDTHHMTFMRSDNQVFAAHDGGWKIQ